MDNGGKFDAEQARKDLKKAGGERGRARTARRGKFKETAYSRVFAEKGREKERQERRVHNSGAVTIANGPREQQQVLEGPPNCPEDSTNGAAKTYGGLWYGCGRGGAWKGT